MTSIIESLLVTRNLKNCINKDIFSKRLNKNDYCRLTHKI